MMSNKQITPVKNKSNYPSKQPLYIVWQGIKGRCNNPNNISHPWYGAKGIKMCKNWSGSYSSFKKWALKNNYKKGLCISRKNSNKNYSPSNCEWLTQAENNKRSPRTVLFKGENMSQASFRLGGKEDMVANRIRKGMKVEEAFTKHKN